MAASKAGLMDQKKDLTRAALMAALMAGCLAVEMVASKDARKDLK